MSSFIQVEKVWKSYNAKHLTPSPISFRLDSDRPFILIKGDNGTGKTTLINIIIGLEIQSGGNVYLSSLSDVSVLFQNEGLLPLLTVLR